MDRAFSRSAAFAAVFSLYLSFPVSADSAAESRNEYLDMDLSQLMGVTITSVAKKPQTLADAAAAVFVISQEDIRRSGVTTIADALAMAPGLQVARISASKWSISSRGFAGYTSNKLLVLLDGRSVYSPAYSGTFWDMQGSLLEDIERIEVIRGPGATLWGANAVNGVINIITQKAEDTTGGLVRVGAGSQERFNGGARWGGRFGATTYGRLYMTYNDYLSNTLQDGDNDANDGWRPAQTGFRLDGTPAPGREWALQGDVFKNQEDETIFPLWTTQPPYLTRDTSEADVEGANILGRWRHDVGPDSAITLQAYYDHNLRDEKTYQQKFATVDLDLQFQTPVGERQSLTMGGGYRSITADFDESFQVVLPDRSDNLFNVFLQDEIGLTDSLSLTLGSKYEHNDYTGSEWQPSAKVMIKPKENHSLWASLARAVRTPSLADRYGRVVIGVFPTSQGVGVAAFTGDGSFDSETLIASETGYRWQASDALSIDLALFFNSYEELYTLRPQPSGTGYDFVFINGVDGESYGFEAVADWKAAPWLSFVFTYSWLEIDLAVTEPGGLAIAADYAEGASPAHQFSIRSAITPARDWQFNLWLRYVDSISSRNSADLLGRDIEIERYIVLDANIIWTLRPDFEVMLAGQNLTDDSQLQYAMEYLTPPTEIERLVYGKITWRF